MRLMGVFVRPILRIGRPTTDLVGGSGRPFQGIGILCCLSGRVISKFGARGRRWRVDLAPTPGRRLSLGLTPLFRRFDTHPPLYLFEL